MMSKLQPEFLPASRGAPLEKRTPKPRSNAQTSHFPTGVSGSYAGAALGAATITFSNGLVKTIV